jgi:hypothetical protein
MPRFVLLQHDHPHLHWDLMLEAGEVLWTWRLEAPPDAVKRVGAVRIGDHRLHYLSYEGPLSGNRGQVRREDHGLFTLVEASDRAVRVRVQGERLSGEVELVRGEGEKWEAIYRPS